MTNSILIRLQQAFPNLEFEAQTPLAPFTHMKVGGPAEVLWKATDREQLAQVVEWCFQEQVMFVVLGGASNVVVADKGIDGLVILNQCQAVETISAEQVIELIGASDLAAYQATRPQADLRFLVADSGIKTAKLVRESIGLGGSGLEPFLGVPGTLGGAIYNNSHYTHELIGTYVVAVEGITESGERRWWSQAECAFAYDLSRFHHTRDVILQVILAVEPGDAAASMAQLAESTKKRTATQPLNLPSSGCMFQNVTLSPEQRSSYDGQEKLSAGWLIDQAGLKGYQIGGAQVSPVHANFIVNTGSATAQDVEQLAAHIQAVVLEKFGIPLQREVFSIGKKGE